MRPPTQRGLASWPCFDAICKSACRRTWNFSPDTGSKIVQSSAVTLCTSRRSKLWDWALTQTDILARTSWARADFSSGCTRIACQMRRSRTSPTPCSLSTLTAPWTKKSCSWLVAAVSWVERSKNTSKQRRTQTIHGFLHLPKMLICALTMRRRNSSSDIARRMSFTLPWSSWRAVTCRKWRRVSFRITTRLMQMFFVACTKSTATRSSLSYLLSLTRKMWVCRLQKSNCTMVLAIRCMSLTVHQSATSKFYRAPTARNTVGSSSPSFRAIYLEPYRNCARTVRSSTRSWARLQNPRLLVLSSHAEEPVRRAVNSATHPI